MGTFPPSSLTGVVRSEPLKVLNLGDLRIGKGRVY